MPADRLVHLAVAPDIAPDDGTILAFHCAGLQLFHQTVLCRDGFGDDQQATGVLVQAVHNACARQFLQLRQIEKQSIQ